MSLFPWQQASWQKLFLQPEKMPHALLLEGPQGQGKLHFAQSLAQSLLCLSPNDDHTACQSCQSCLWFNSQNHPDYIFIGLTEDTDQSDQAQKRPSTQILIEHIRALDDIVYQTTYLGKPRVILIDQVDRLHLNAANAFLKKLEEPSSHTRYILVTAHKHRLLPTILSRCQLFSAGIASKEMAIDWLISQSVTEAEKWFDRSQSPLGAKCLADLGIDLSDTLIHLFSQYRKEGALFLAEQIEKNEITKKSIDSMDQLILSLQKINYDLILLSKSLKAHYHPDKTAMLQSLLAGCQVNSLMRYEQQLIDYRKQTSHPLNPKLFIEAVLLDCPFVC